MWPAVSALLRKELRLELRTFQVIPAMALFSISTLIVFHFSLQQNTVEGPLAAGVLTVTLLFSAILGINRLFVADHEEDGFDGFLLAPVDRTALLVAKAIALFGFLVVLEVVAVPAFDLMLLDPNLANGPALGQTALTLLLADLALAIVGTLVGALAIQTRARDLIVPLIALPLLLPVVIGTAKLLAPTFAVAGAQALPGRWLAILALYDLIFGLLSYAVFDFLIED
ncbi:MAG TPA: heme exporter protein CcmB [Baekduia sp.]|uniref:heme exporter protein CcmB n=1 Tax=Baekduia sp. TaxID=2600305 RepID=UPI002D79D82E|nr:heme exporter protein CcmB [Baekduia sp.]HET6508705.1 heme exporter protein CcmB [Baekduia sp.]